MREQIGRIDTEHSFLFDNEHIQTGYRLYFHSTGKIFRSLFMLHNESVNVWSHLVGMLLFFSLLVYSTIWLSSHSPELQGHFVKQYHTLGQRAVQYSESLNLGVEELLSHAKDCEGRFEAAFRSLYGEAVGYEQAVADRISELYSEIAELPVNLTEKYRVAEHKLKNLSKRVIQRIDSPEYDWLDFYHPVHSPETSVSRWPLCFFLLSAMLCLGMSSVYHLFNAYSRTVNRFVSILDYAGISILVMGSYYPAVYYAFYCEPFYIVLHLGGITVASLCVFTVTLFPFFQLREYRWFRGFIFLALGVSGAIPLVHVCFRYSLLSPQIDVFRDATIFYLMTGASYILGVLVYVNKVPERFFPGKFDFWGNSHNIWHLFVLAAVISHYFGSLEAYHARVTATCDEV